MMVIYIGYAIGTMHGEDIRLDNVLEMTRDAILHPLPLRATAMTKNSLLCALGAWLLAFLMYYTSLRNYMPGAEFGTARFAEAKKVVKKVGDKQENRNKILSERLRISVDTRFTRLNNNVLAIGGAGTGKSKLFVAPNIMQNLDCTYIFTDPKGELYRENAAYLAHQGYRIKVLNLVDFVQSDGYNPFAYIRTDEDVVKLITNLIANTTPKGAQSQDPFWEKAEGMYLQALFYYVWKEAPKQEKTPNFAGVLELLNKARIPEDEDELSELDELMYALEEDHIALLTYNKVRRGATDTVRSIIISANSRLAYLQNPEILRILDHDEMDIPGLGTGQDFDGNTKTALFCVIPDNDKSYNFIVGLLYTQIFQELYFQADFNYGGRLPVPVMLWMDEFANVALPDDFCSLLSTMRSREISCNIIIQNLAQIKALFKDTWETVTGNCDVLVYLGGNEQSTHKYISELLGKWTIDKRSSGESFGSHGSASRNYDVLGRELMTPDEVRKIPNEKCIVFIRGLDPVYDLKYRTFEKKSFKELGKFGEYDNKKGEKIQAETERQDFESSIDAMKEGADGMAEDFSASILNGASVRRYQELEKKGENVVVWEFTEQELLDMDLDSLVQENEDMTMEDLNAWIEENRESLKASYQEARELQEEIGQLEHGQATGGLAITDVDTMANRLLKFDYTDRQKEQAHIGIVHGLTEDVVLAYFRPENSVEDMAMLRTIAEKKLLG